MLSQYNLIICEHLFIFGAATMHTVIENNFPTLEEMSHERKEFMYDNPLKDPFTIKVFSAIAELGTLLKENWKQRIDSTKGLMKFFFPYSHRESYTAVDLKNLKECFTPDVQDRIKNVVDELVQCYILERHPLSECGMAFSPDETYFKLIISDLGSKLLNIPIDNQPEILPRPIQ